MNNEPPMVEFPTNMDDNGLPICPYCGCNASEVTHTYPWADGRRRRRRVCDHCLASFYTIQPPEVIELD